jgi:hypothetical protein
VHRDSLLVVYDDDDEVYPQNPPFRRGGDLKINDTKQI